VKQLPSSTNRRHFFDKLYNLDPNRLGFGYGVNGAMTRSVKVPERCLHHIPDGLSFRQAALTEPCCVAYNATCVHSRIQPGASVAIIGPGPIGLLCASMAKIAGADHLGVIGIPADAKRSKLLPSSERTPYLGRKARTSQNGLSISGTATV
jgi:threonine dehydrogenase-like Zn-dependent dehydrogenase